VIGGYADLLAEDLEPRHPLQLEVEEIRAASRSAACLTRQLLAFSRRQILQPQIVDLNEIIGRVERLLRRVIGEDILLTMTLRAPLWPVYADPGQIEQVVMNLAVNARDAMPKGGRLTIETADVELDEVHAAQHRGATPGRHVLLAVSDTGVGIDPATQKRLFEPFFTTKAIGRGTGLGLATVYGIVKQSHGSIWVYSEIGKGSTFKIYLPAVAHGHPQAPEPSAGVPVLEGAERILLLEDQPEVRDVIAATLGRHGYSVVPVASAAEALAAVRNGLPPIDLLLTDVVMPDASGRDVARQIVFEQPTVRVLYMSGYTDDAIVRHGVLDAGLAFIQKPFSNERLLRKVRSVLDGAPPKP
jgi:CheY-like chemotaxis protein